MRCGKFKKFLPGYLYGEASPKDKRALVIHASGCPACRKLMEEMEETILLIRSRVRPAFSESELSTLRARVQEEIVRREVAPARRSPRILWQPVFQPRFAPVTIALLFALMVGAVFLFRGGEKGDSPVAPEVSGLMAMAESISEEFQSVSEICREIDYLQSLFPEESDSEAALFKNRNAAPA